MLKSQLFEKQSNELKGLFTRITKATDPKVKAQLATIAKKLDESLKGLTTEIHDLRDQIQKSGKKSKSSLLRKRKNMSLLKLVLNLSILKKLSRLWLPRNKKNFFCLLGELFLELGEIR
jgi:uncharacterized phage infection (PIP) family protein YhgE